MDKKKLGQSISAILTFIAVVVVLVVVFRAGKHTGDAQNGDGSGVEPSSKTKSFAAVIENIEAQMLETTENETMSGNVEDESPKINFVSGQALESVNSFGEYKSLEKTAFINSDEEHVEEIWLVKLDSFDEQTGVFRSLGNRVQRLKEIYKNNEKQLAVIENAIIKQENGIVIMIVAENSNEIEKIIDGAIKGNK